MEATINSFQREIAQVEVVDKNGNKQVVNKPIAVITLISELPDVLPVGKIVELNVKKEKKV